MKRRNQILAVFMILLMALLAGLIIVKRTRPNFPAVKMPFLRTVKTPERVPSAGYRWSKAEFPEQYDRLDNWHNVTMVGMNDPDGERFMDVGGSTYRHEFIPALNYENSETCEVYLQYLIKAETFTGKITARGLKPNFAYQVKLRGVQHDIASFERIGYTGRWRLGAGLNYTDDDYRRLQDKSKAESYLLFDYFITDAAGNAEKIFYADSSLHVLWNATYQRRPGPRDSLPVSVRRGPLDPQVYVIPRTAPSADLIYAEAEQQRGQPPRPGIGQAFLPPGEYNAELVLTEESFHGYGDAGQWPTVMVAPVQFEVIPERHMAVLWDTSEPVNSLLQAKGPWVDEFVVQDDVSGVARAGWSWIEFDGTYECSAEARYIFTAELKDNETGKWSFAVLNGPDFEHENTYRIHTHPWRGWRTFEVEITSAAAGQACRIRVFPTSAGGRFTLRNAAIHRILPTPPVSRAVVRPGNRGR